MQPNLNRPSARLVVLVAAALLLAGCGDDNGTDAQTGSTTTTIETSTTTEAAAAPVSVASNPTLGQIVVDADGLTLYVFDADKDGKIACVDAACTGAWPPLVLEAGASLPTTGALGPDLSAVARPDGARQVAYNARPLYRFAGDTKPGDTKGDGVVNLWHVVKVGAAGGGAATTVASVRPY